MDNVYLFIVDKYLTDPTSNALCVKNIINSLANDGIKAVILSLYDKEDCIINDYTKLFSIKIDKTNTLLFDKLFNYLEDRNTVKKLVCKGQELNSKYRFRKVIGVFRPIESILAALLLADELCVKSVIMFFDVPISPSMILYKQKIVSHNYCRLYKRIFKSSNVIAFKYYKNHFKNCLPVQYYDKIIFIGTPSLVSKNCRNELHNDNAINLVYAGSFYDKIRNPRKMLYALSGIAGTNIYFHIYSWGCEDVLEEYKKLYGNNLVIHGRVSSQEVETALVNANILVNLSNISENQVPGKVMEYFSYGKPVLNFKSIENDPGNEDYEAYPLIKNVELYADVNKQEIIDFINDYKDKQIPFIEIAEKFKDSTPEYCCQMIEGIL